MYGASKQIETDPPKPGFRSAHHRGRSVTTVACLVLAGATVIASGCAGGSPSKQADGATTTVAPTTTSTPPTPARGEVPAAPGSTLRPAREVSTGGGGGSGSLPFVADTNPDVSKETDGFPVLVSVTKGLHDGYVRYVFLFRHADPDGHQPWREWARPAWDTRYVPASDAVMDGFGEPVVNAGAKAHLLIRFNANMRTPEGDSTIQTSVNSEDALAFGGDFEGNIRWFYGADRERPFRVDYVGDGRVAVDIVT